MMQAIFTSIWTGSPACYLIIAGIFVTSLFSIYNKTVLTQLFFHPYSVISNHQYYRLISGDFVHNDIIHLFINEIILVTFGSNLESYLNLKMNHGSLAFLTIYLGSCLAGTIPAAIRHFRDFTYSSAGASGTITGCIFSYVMLRPKETAYFLPAIGAVNNLYGGLVFLMGLIIYRWKSDNELINHEVHFYGAIGGIVITLLLIPGII